MIELGTGFGGLVNPGEHGFAGDGAKDFPGEAGRSEPRGDDAENGRRLLFAVPRIKYDWNWLCRDDSPKPV